MTDTPTNDPNVPLEEDPRPDGLRVAKSLVVVNTGDGKGKSSAAFGVAMRARARDWPVAARPRRHLSLQRASFPGRHYPR